jgi:hypothetical protein
MPARDSRKCLAGAIQRQHRLDLRAQLAGIDEPSELLQPLPAAMRGDRFLGNAPLKLGRSPLQDDECTPDRYRGLR